MVFVLTAGEAALLQVKPLTFLFSGPEPSVSCWNHLIFISRMQLLFVLSVLVGTVLCGSVRKGAPQMNPPQTWEQGPGSYPSPGVEVYVAPEEGGYAEEYPAYSELGPESSEPEVQETTEANEEEEQPVFSDVSDLEPVFSISSRSSYQRGRAIFSQTRYIPGPPPPPPPMPVLRVSSSVPERPRPADVPVKKGFA